MRRSNDALLRKLTALQESIEAALRTAEYETVSIGMALGRALLDKRLGTADDKQIAALRHDLHRANTEAEDLRLIQGAIPGRRSDLSAELAIDNAEMLTKVRARRMAEYEAALKTIDAARTNRDRDELHAAVQRARDLAVRAGKLEHFRKHCKPYNLLGAKR